MLRAASPPQIRHLLETETRESIMGILEGLKRTLNIAGSKIIVVTEDQNYSQGDSVRGEVEVIASDYKLTGNSINLELKEFWTETRSTGKTTTTVTVHKTHATVVFEGAFDYEPGSRHRFPFDVELPRNCRISTPHTGWCLSVSLDIPRAVDPSERVVLEVQPAEEFLAIVEVCEESLRFREKQKSRKWNTRASTTYFRLLPPEALESELDYLAFELSQADDGGVEGDLIFNVQEKSIADYFKAIVGKDKIRRQFHLASSQLNSQDGRVNREEIAVLLKGMMKEVIDQRNPTRHF